MTHRLGARKIRELLVRRLDRDIRVLAKSTIHAILDRHGLVKRIAPQRSRCLGSSKPLFSKNLLRAMLFLPLARRCLVRKSRKNLLLRMPDAAAN
jgi:hypothetical protein